MKTMCTPPQNTFSPTSPGAVNLWDGTAEPLASIPTHSTHHALCTMIELCKVQPLHLRGGLTKLMAPTCSGT